MASSCHLSALRIFSSSDFNCEFNAPLSLIDIPWDLCLRFTKAQASIINQLAINRCKTIFLFDRWNVYSILRLEISYVCPAQTSIASYRLWNISQM